MVKIFIKKKSIFFVIDFFHDFTTVNTELFYLSKDDILIITGTR